MVQLSNGRRLVCNGGVMGIDEGLRLYDGYNCLLQEAQANSLSPNEKRDLANIMIQRWMAFGRGFK